MGIESQPTLPGLEEAKKPEYKPGDSLSSSGPAPEKIDIKRAEEEVERLADLGVNNTYGARIGVGLDRSPAPTSLTYDEVDQSKVTQCQPDYLGSGSGFAPPSTKEAKRALARNLPKIRQAVLGVVARDGNSAKIQAFKNKHGME